METKRIKGRLAVWHPCVECGFERWVLLRRGVPQSQRCYPCGRKYVVRTRKVTRGPEHPLWKGGRSVMKLGYVEVWVSADDPLAPMRNKDGYVYEHRLVMARSLGRCLIPGEEVHHLNGQKHDNALENLRLLTKSGHAAWHAGELGRLREEVRSLREELRQARAG